MTETTWLWVGCAGMALGAVALFVVGHRRTQDEEAHTQIHVIVPVIASLSYFAMATRQGAITLSSGRELLAVRYLDWLITTPLLLLALAMTALHGAHRRTSLVAALLGADALMIVTGFCYAASEATGPKWTWFLVSCGAFVAVYATLLGPLRREACARDAVRRAVYARTSLLLAVLWLLYPVIDLLGDNGLRVWSPVLTTASLTVVDLAAKIAFGFVAIAGSSKVADHDLAAGRVTPVEVHTRAVPSSGDSRDAAPRRAAPAPDPRG